MANLGLGIVFVAVPWLYIDLNAAGVLYFAWLASATLRPDGKGLFEAQSLARDSRLKLFRMGLVTNLLNPKAAVMYLAIIPQFIDHGQGNTTAQGFVLGGVQIIVRMIVNSLIVLGAGTISGFVSTRPTWIKWQRWVTGTLLSTVAVMLAREVPQSSSPLNRAIMLQDLRETPLR